MTLSSRSVALVSRSALASPSPGRASAVRATQSMTPPSWRHDTAAIRPACPPGARRNGRQRGLRTPKEPTPRPQHPTMKGNPQQTRLLRRHDSAAPRARFSPGLARLWPRTSLARPGGSDPPTPGHKGIRGKPLLCNRTPPSPRDNRTPPITHIRFTAISRQNVTRIGTHFGTPSSSRRTVTENHRLPRDLSPARIPISAVPSGGDPV